MKILVNACGAHEGGALTILNSFCSDIEDSMNDYIIMSPVKPEKLRANFIWIKCGGGSLFSFLFTLIYSSCWAYFYQCDKIISFSNFNAMFFFRKRVTYFHNALIVDSTAWKYVLIRNILRFINQRNIIYIFQTNAIYEDFCNNIFKVKNYKISWPGIELGYYGLTASSKNSDCILVPITDISSKHKNFPLVIELAMALQDHKILVTADGGGGLDLPKNILFVGKKEHNAFIELLSKSKFLFVPSTHETICLPIFESLYLGISVVALRKKYIEELVFQFDVKQGVYLFDYIEQIPLIMDEFEESIFDRNKMIQSDWNF